MFIVSTIMKHSLISFPQFRADMGLVEPAINELRDTHECSSARYNTHLYRLAVQAGFYSDAIECWISTQETLVRSSVGAKRLFASFSPVTFILARSDETSSRSLAFDALNYGI